MTEQIFYQIKAPKTERCSASWVFW